MSKTNMPAAEAGELQSYELAFHVLPTVAEGEVATIFQSLKDKITKAEGVLTSEEEPARFDLAYEIVKYLEGRNRKFTSAYFGWVRFTAAPAKVEKLEEEVAATPELLRHLLVKLTKVEEANPFMFHEALDAPVVQDIEVGESEAAEATSDTKETTVETKEKEEDGEESADKV